MKNDHLAVDREDGPMGHPHLVIKKGHRGRYRFVMIDEGDRIGGEVWIEPRADTQNVLQAHALAKITRLAEALQAEIQTRATIEQNLSEKKLETDEAPALLQQTLGAGDHHGEV